MTTELIIGAINPGYGGLPIGVAAALGGAQLAWHAHPDQPFDYAGRMLMRYHHPYAGAHTVIDAPPPMVDVLTVNGYNDWTFTGRSLIGVGYKPPLVIVETESHRSAAVTVCGYLRSRGYRAAWQTTRASDVGAPHRRPRVYVIAVRKDCTAFAVDGAYLDAARCVGRMWPTPELNDPSLLETAYQWVAGEVGGHPDKALTYALEQWEKVTGEHYPHPLYTIPTPETMGRLSLSFMEWMMGLPVGYVSTPSLPIVRAERRHLLQTGTVPLQAAHAVAVGLTQMGEQ